MLRGLFLAVVAANLLFLAWSQGWMAPAWPGPRVGQAEPLRLANQVRPEWVQILPASAAASRVAGARRVSRICLEAGPLDDAAVAAADAAMAAAALPDGSGVQRRAEAGVVWFRADGADAALQARLLALPASELAGGFKPCQRR